MIITKQTKMTKLKTIKLKGNDYVQVNTRVDFFNQTYTNGRIATEVKFENSTVWFKAVVTPDLKNPERYFVGHSFGELGKEKAFEKLETVAAGRALAFMGIGIVDSIASSDEIANFHNKQEPQPSSHLGACSVCGTTYIEGPYGPYCPKKKSTHDDNKGYMLAPVNNMKTPF